MKKLSPEELAALGVAPGAELRLVGRDAPSDDRVGRGFAGSDARAMSAEARLARFRSVTPVEGFRATAASLGAPAVEITRADGTPDLFMLSLEGIEVDHGAPVERVYDGEACIVDSREGPVTLRARGPAGDCLLRFEDDTVEWYDIVANAAALTAPAVEALLSGFDAPAWMTAPLETARTTYAICAAVGTLGRLWAPKGTATSASVAMQRVMADDDPLARARRWFGALDDAARDALTALAITEARALTDALEGLRSQAIEASSEARDAALAWLERRDDLASVTALLGVKPGTSLSGAVSALDRVARAHATMWRALSPIRAPRLDAVSWQEPDAWWAEPARTR